MDLDYTAIGMRIRDARKRSRLSQATLSELVDLSPSYISYIENGVKGMSLETFVMIANALDVSTDLLLMEQINGGEVYIIEEISKILAGCDKSEAQIILETMRTLRDALKKDQPGII